MSDYDGHQLAAYRVRCVRCCRWWDMTRIARLLCRDCRGDCRW